MIILALNFCFFCSFQNEPGVVVELCEYSPQDRANLFQKNERYKLNYTFVVICNSLSDDIFIAQVLRSLSSTAWGNAAVLRLPTTPTKCSLIDSFPFPFWPAIRFRVFHVAHNVKRLISIQPICSVESRDHFGSFHFSRLISIWYLSTARSFDSWWNTILVLHPPWMSSLHHPMEQIIN